MRLQELRMQLLGVMQVDFLMSGLMVLKERIDATEALIAIDLDNRRNELVAFDLVSESAHESALRLHASNSPIESLLPTTCMQSPALQAYLLICLITTTTSSCDLQQPSSGIDNSTLMSCS